MIMLIKKRHKTKSRNYLSNNRINRGYVLNTYKCPGIYRNVYVNACICIYVRICIYIYICVCINVQVYIRLATKFLPFFFILEFIAFLYYGMYFCFFPVHLS